MVLELDKYINKRLYNIRHVLERQRDSLYHEISSADEDKRDKAWKQICLIDAWLYPLTSDEILRQRLDALDNEILCPQERRAAARRMARLTPKGRPAIAARKAIRALSLRLATSKTWREIAFIVGDCNHERPKSERGCSVCRHSIKSAVRLLEQFLRGVGYHPHFSHCPELDRMSYTDLRRLFGTPP